MEDYASDFVFLGKADDDYEWGEGFEEENNEEEGEGYEGFLVEKTLTDGGDSIDSRRPSERERFSSLPSYAARWLVERAKEAAALEEKKKEELRKLMGLDHGKRDGESIETVLSEEEEEEEKKSEEVTSSDESSDLCLVTVDVSDSQLKLLNIYRDYPVPEDPGLVPAFWTLYAPQKQYKEDGIQKFHDLVEEMGLLPVASIKDMLRTDTVNIRHYRIDPRIFQALCEAIPNNTTVQNLDLRDNFLTPDFCYHLNKLLILNGIISRVDLSGCKIGPKGAKRLQEGIKAATALEELDLSRCNLGDEGLRYISSAICYSHTLEDVNLSDNHLNDDSAKSLKTMFLQSEVLKRLDLSWNSLYSREFAKTFFEGLARNETLEYLNMSWNGLGQDCAQSLCQCLANLQTLREFDLSDNRFTKVEGMQIAKALWRNASLDVLRLGENPLEGEGVLALVKALAPEKSPNLRLNTLDLKNVWANNEILPLLKKLEKDRPELKVILGGILGNFKLHGPDPRKIFLKRANVEAMSPKKKKDRKNFGHFILGLTDEPVSRVKFRESLQLFKLKLSDSLADEIMNAFAHPRFGFVDQTALKEFYMKEYPETHLPPPKSPKKKKKAAE